MHLVSLDVLSEKPDIFRSPRRILLSRKEPAPLPRRCRHSTLATRILQQRGCCWVPIARKTDPRSALPQGSLVRLESSEDHLAEVSERVRLQNVAFLHGNYVLTSEKQKGEKQKPPLRNLWVSQESKVQR